MTIVKHRKFSEISFVQHFEGHIEIIEAFLGTWGREALGLGGELTVETFIGYLTAPPTGNEAYESMMAVLHEVNDMCTPSGEQAMSEAEATHRVVLDPDNQLHREAHALKLRTEYPDTFGLAQDMWVTSKFKNIYSFKGRSAKEIPTLDDTMIDSFSRRLEEMFHSNNKRWRVKVRHFRDGDAVNFLVYHDEMPKSYLTLDEKRSVQTGRFLPARQDLITYMPNVGKIEIETGSKKDREAMRRAFGEVCLGDPEFFEEKGADRLLNYAVLQNPDFEFTTHPHVFAALQEVSFFLNDAEGARITVKSSDVYETLRKSGQLELFRTANIGSAKIKIIFPENKRGKLIELSSTNKISFTRSSRVEDVFLYLKDWKLLRD